MLMELHAENERTPYNKVSCKIDLKLSDSSQLENVGLSRSKCEKCGKSRKYYCYSCCLPLASLTDCLPRIQLPIKVHIIKHPGELDGKSTAPHAVILAPDDVTIHTYPCIPDYNSEKVLLVFPSSDSIQIKDLQQDKTCSEDIKNMENKVELEDAHKNFTKTDSSLKHVDENKQDDCVGHCNGNKRKLSDLSEEQNVPFKITKIVSPIPFETVVFVDCTWNQAAGMLKDERFTKLKKVKLENHVTDYWRNHEGNPKNYLCTIEAIFYCMRELHERFIDKNYSHQYDDLLFLFYFLRSKVHSAMENIKQQKQREVLT